MSNNDRLRNVAHREGIPVEVLQSIDRLFKRRERLNFRMLPKDAYMIAALIQFADRNPNISDEHHEMLWDFGNQLVDAVTDIEPILHTYLMAGWDPLRDVKIKREDGTQDGK